MSLFWRWFHKLYSAGEGVRISIPMRLYSNFNYHFWLYDEEGNVKEGAKTMFEALRRRKETGLFVTRIIERGR